MTINIYSIIYRYARVCSYRQNVLGQKSFKQKVLRTKCLAGKQSYGQTVFRTICLTYKTSFGKTCYGQNNFRTKHLTDKMSYKLNALRKKLLTNKTFFCPNVCHTTRCPIQTKRLTGKMSFRKMPYLQNVG